MEREAPKKILYYTDEWVSGGIGAFIMNIYRNIDVSRYKIDILVSEDKCNIYDSEIEHFGGHKKQILSKHYSSPIMRTLKSFSAFYSEIKKSEYDIVHFHICNAVGFIYILLAKKAGVEVLICHSHNTSLGSGLMKPVKLFAHNAAKKLLRTVPTHRFACSKPAAEWMYNKSEINSVKYIHNGIDVRKFIYNAEQRSELRKELGIDDRFVVCHVGRFINQKNHDFLIDIFAQIKKKEPKAYLLLVGEGNLENEIREKVKSLGLQDSVRFVGVTHDVPKYLWASDVFILPSFFEGLPVVAVEAQAAGLHMVASDAITSEARLTDLLDFVSLSDSPEIWADKALKYDGVSYRQDTYSEIVAAGYDIKSVADDLASFYEKVL